MKKISFKVALFVALSGSLLVAACKGGSTTSKRTSRLRADDAQKNPLAIGVKLDGDTSPTLHVGIPNTSKGSVVLCQSKTQIKNCGSATVLTMSSPQTTGDRLIYSTQSAVVPENNGVYFAVEVGGQLSLGFHLFDPKSPTPSPTPNDSEKHPGDTTGLTAKEIEVIDLINQYHKDYKLDPCTLTAELNGFAKENSKAQERAGASGHYTSLPYNGEIAFYGPTTAKDTFIGWKHSPGHDGLMKTGFTKCGVSAGSNGNSWTVSFKQ